MKLEAVNNVVRDTETRCKVATVPTEIESDAIRDRSHCHELAKLFAQAPAMAERIEELEATLRGIINDLPSKRDWLDPALEAEARALLEEAK